MLYKNCCYTNEGTNRFSVFKEKPTSKYENPEKWLVTKPVPTTGILNIKIKLNFTNLGLYSYMLVRV